MSNPSSKLCSLVAIGTGLVAIAAPTIHASELVLDHDVRQVYTELNSDYIGGGGGSGIGGGGGALPYGTPWIESTRSNNISQDGYLEIDSYASQSSTIDTITNSWTGTNTTSTFVAPRIPLTGSDISSSASGESIFDMIFTVSETTQARLVGSEYSLQASSLGVANIYAGVFNTDTGELLYSFSDDTSLGGTSGSFDSGLLDFEAGQFYGLYIYAGSTTSVGMVQNNPVLESASSSLSYNFSIVPAPSSAIALGLGGLVSTRRRRG